MRQTRAAQLRRRRLATSVAVAGTLAVVVVLATQLPAHSHDHSGGAGPTVTPTISASPGLMPSKSLHDVISAYLKHRDGAVSVAVYDNVSKHLTLVHPAVRGRTASIVKVDILETLLHKTGGHLSESQRETATSMIEESDNDSATDLWNQDGGAPGVAAYNSDVGLTQTTPNVDWGDTTTSAANQVTLIRELLGPSTLLTNSARKFQRTLMRHVEADQQWGISSGVPKNATFGIKNGWLPVSEDNNLWAVNSIGWVHGDSKRYEIAVITQHDATEGYGIATIQHIARMAWKHAAVSQS